MRGFKSRRVKPSVLGKAVSCFFGVGKACEEWLRGEKVEEAFMFMASMSVIPSAGGAGLAFTYILLMGSYLQVNILGTLLLTFLAFTWVWVSSNFTALLGASVLYLLTGFMEPGKGLSLGTLMWPRFTPFPRFLLGWLIAFPFLGLLAASALLILSLPVLSVILKRMFKLALAPFYSPSSAWVSPTSPSSCFSSASPPPLQT